MESKHQQQQEAGTHSETDLLTCASIKSADGVYLYVRANSEEMFGVPCSAMIGKTDFHWQNDSVAQQLRRNDRKVLTSKQKLLVTETASHPDGRDSIWLVEKFCLAGKNAMLVGVLGIDITKLMHTHAGADAIAMGMAALEMHEPLKRELASIAATL